MAAGTCQREPRSRPPWLLFVLAARLAEAAAWGLFLRWTELIPKPSEGISFTAATITTLGYGDILLKYPRRIISRDIDCDDDVVGWTLLFVILQDILNHHFVEGPVEEPSESDAYRQPPKL